MSDIIDINVDSPSPIEIIVGSSPDITIETPAVIEILVGSSSTMDIAMESPTHELEILGATRGDDGHTPYIEDGYWFINGVSTGVKSAGEQGIPGIDSNYTKTFNVSSSVDVNHNLNKLVSVSVIDSANDEVIGDIAYIDPNNIRVVFTSAFSGTIICN